MGDFIRHGIEFLKEEGARDESVINSDSEHARVLSAIVKIDTQKVQEWLHLVKIKTKNSDETRIWKENLQLILCQQDLINVYYHNSNESLEKSILRKVPQFFSLVKFSLDFLSGNYNSSIPNIRFLEFRLNFMSK